MGLFNSLSSLFSTSDNEPAAASSGWNTLSSEEEVDDVIAASNARPQVIMKHSTRCATSYFALKNLQQFPEELREQIEMNIVDVIQHRGVSNYISQRLHIPHESPQLLILLDGELRWAGSHGQVQVDAIRSFLEEA